VISRESQLAYTGEIVTLESMIEYELIKPEFIELTKKRIEKIRKKITYKDILECLGDYKHA